MENFRERVNSVIIDRLEVDESEINPEADFISDLKADSLDMVELLMEIEKEFGIKIPDQDQEKMKTVGDVYAYLESL